MKQKERTFAKVNTNFFITYQSKNDMKLSSKSLQNLHGKMKSGFLSRRSMVLLENTAKNYLLAQMRYQNNKKGKTAENKTLTHIPPQNPPHKMPTQGGTVVSETVLRNENETRKRRNTEGVINSYRVPNLFPFFLTLTASHDSGTLPKERLLFSAFRRFLKDAKASYGLSYIWKVEKSSEAYQHFHVIGDCFDASELENLWNSTCRNLGISVMSPHSFDLKSISLDATSIRSISRYFSKQTDFPIDSKICSMSLDMREFRALTVTDEEQLILMLEDAEIRYISEGSPPFYTLWQSITVENAMESWYDEKMLRHLGKERL